MSAPVDGGLDVGPSLLELTIVRGDERRSLVGGARRVEIARAFRAEAGCLVPDRNFGRPTLEQLRALHSKLSGRLHDEIVAGATSHRRLPLLVRWLPWTVALLDGLVLYAFCADIFNVETLQLNRSGLAALALAVLGSAIAFTWLGLTGTALRDYRTGLGEIAWREMRSLSWGLIAGSVVVIGALAVLMYARVFDQAVGAAGAYLPPDQVGLVAWVFAILSACANLTVVAVHALDGTALSAQAGRAGHAVRRAERRLGRARRRAWRRAVRAYPCADPLGDQEWRSV